MNSRITIIITLFLLFTLPSVFPKGLFIKEIIIKYAEAYYGNYSAGNVQGTGRSTIRGTGTIGGHYVTYYTNIPGNCIELKSSGINYYNCSGDYYRPYYLGNEIVYVKESP